MAARETFNKWAQAARVAISFAVTLVVFYIFMQKVAETNFRIGLGVGMQQCSRGALFEEAFWETDES